MNPVDENQKAEKLTDSPELRINPVGDASSELITNPTHDTNNDSESNIMDEAPKTFNHEEYNGVQSDPSFESFANTEVDQFFKVNPVDESQKEEKLTDSPELQINLVEDVSLESITKPAHETFNDFESAISDENPETVNHEEYNEDQSEQSPESFANMEIDQFSKENLVDESQKEEKLTDSPELQN